MIIYKSLLLLVLCPVIALAEDKSSSNSLSKIDSVLSKVTYEPKSYATTNNVSGQNVERLVESIAQSPDKTRAKGSGNCADIARLTKELAEKEGLKAKYIIEKRHIAVRVETKSGASYRYSNGKRTGRCW